MPKPQQNALGTVNAAHSAIQIGNLIFAAWPGSESSGQGAAITLQKLKENRMKHLKIGLGIIVVGGVLALTTNKRVMAAPQDKQPHQVVILHASESGYPTNHNGHYVYQYDGMQVYCSSSSAGAPAFPQMGIESAGNNTTILGNLVQLAQAIAQLQDQGFVLAQVPGHGGGDYVLTK